MTDQIATLLRERAADVHVPVPDTGAILRDGRRRRRVRGAAQVTGTLAVVAALLAAGSTLRPDPPAPTAQERFENASPAAAYSRYGAFSAGNVVYVGNHRVRFEDKIKALYYTSAGVLVRAGRSAATDSAGASRYTLIRPDGEITPVPLKMGDRVPGTDIDSPNVAYAAPTSNPRRWDFIVTDVTTGKEVARTTVTGDFTWGGWEAPPVDTDGTRMWAHFDDGWTEFDWGTGKIRKVPGTREVSETAHGTYAARGKGVWTFREWVSGVTVGELRMTRDDYGFLSPDGRFLRTWNQMAFFEEGEDVPAPRFYDIAAGTSHTVAATGEEFGWTPDGQALLVDAKRDTITTCDVTTGSCSTVHREIENQPVKLGGEPYES